MFPDKYCGDKVFEDQLKKAAAKIPLTAIYGLFYGSLAAPELVKPSQYIPIIFGEEGSGFADMKEANEVIGNLMSLWNILAEWNPEKEPFLYPDIEYQDTIGSLTERVRDNSFLVKFFIKGLDLGGTKEEDFSEDGMRALKSLSKAGVFLEKSIEVFNKQENINDKEVKETSELIIKLEDIIADCIMRINVGLKDARMRMAEEMRMLVNSQKRSQQIKSTKIPKNEPCPCGSGKKYKKCCGLTH